MNNDLRPINTIPNFKRFCMTIGELPTSYLETMTYYEMLVWFTEYMKNTIIPTINNNGLAVEELQDKYIELKTYVDNYFTNLDVQEEINNKLDKMAESGQLTDIIAQYLGLAGMIVFNTVNEMKNATNLVNGSKCETLGFHEVNDDGNAIYKIRNVTNEDTIDEASIIALADNTLVAELIIDDNINVKQFGGYGDNIHDDTIAIQNAINYAGTQKGVVYFPNGLYLISDELLLNKTIKIKGLAKMGITNDNVIYGSQIKQTNDNKDIFKFTSANYGSIFEDIRLSHSNPLNNTCVGINSEYFFSESYIKNVSFLQGLHTCIRLKDVGSVLIDSCYFSINDIGIDIIKGTSLNITNNNFWNNNIDIKVTQINDSYITNNWFESNNSNSIGLLFQAPSIAISSVINKNAFQKINTCVKFDGTTNISDVMGFRLLNFKNNRFTGSTPWIINMKNEENVVNRNAGNYWLISIEECLFNNATSGAAINLDYDVLGIFGFYIKDSLAYSSWSSGSIPMFTSGIGNTAPTITNNMGIVTDGSLQFKPIINYQLKKNNSIFLNTANVLSLKDNDGHEFPLLTNKSGTSGNRPVTANVGEVYYDTTLHIPLWWSGSSWLDSTGTTHN